MKQISLMAGFILGTLLIQYDQKLPGVALESLKATKENQQHIDFKLTSNSPLLLQTSQSSISVPLNATKSEPVDLKINSSSPWQIVLSPAIISNSHQDKIIDETKIEFQFNDGEWHPLGNQPVIAASGPANVKEMALKLRINSKLEADSIHRYSGSLVIDVFGVY